MYTFSAYKTNKSQDKWIINQNIAQKQKKRKNSIEVWIKIRIFAIMKIDKEYPATQFQWVDKSVI